MTANEKFSVDCFWRNFSFLTQIMYLFNICFITSLKNKIENNSTWEGTFYQSEWVKLIQAELFSLFHFMCVAANAFELFCMAHLASIERFLYHSNLSF